MSLLPILDDAPDEEEKTEEAKRKQALNQAFSNRASTWLDRQILLGLITPEGARAVEKLIEDLR